LDFLVKIETLDNGPCLGVVNLVTYIGMKLYFLLGFDGVSFDVENCNENYANERMK